MERFKGLWRDSKYVWIAFFLVVVVFSILVSPLFLVMIPGLAGYFVYFAFIRYDENGVDKGGAA